MTNHSQNEDDMDKKVMLTIMAVFAMLAVLGTGVYLNTGQANADPIGETVITFTELTPTEWAASSPRQGRTNRLAGTSSGKSWRDSLTEANIAGIKVSWVFQDPDSAIQAYRVERRIIEPPANTIAHDWQLMADRSTNTYYDDTDGAAGFNYEYRITPQTVSEYLTAHETVPRELIAATGFWGKHVGETGIELNVQKLSHWDNRTYRITRYDSPDSSTPDATTITILPQLTVNNLTTGKVYKFVLEQGDYANGVMTDTVIRATKYVKTGVPTLTAPSSLSVSGTAGQGATVNWPRITGVAPGQVALYEILRRNAKDFGSPYTVVGTSVGITTTEGLAATGEYFQYQVRGVSYPHVHGPVSSALSEPIIPRPTCENDNGIVMRVRHLDLQKVENHVPLNDRYGFAVWMRGTSAALQNSLTDCASIDPDDWYVLKHVDVAHHNSDTCRVTGTSCTLENAERVSTTKTLVRSLGTFQSTDPIPGNNMDSKVVWYEDIDSEPGVYRNLYRMCSYGAPQICSQSELFRSEWQFNGVTEIPFTTDDTSTPGSNQ